MDLSTYPISVLAGLLSTLSPCVLPLIPIVVGSSLSQHKGGPAMIAFGLAVSFTLIGVLLGSLGPVLGISQEHLRLVGALMMLIFGGLLLSSAWQAWCGSGLGRVSQWGQSLMDKYTSQQLSGQFILGLLLGLVWTPCVGPVMGATLTLASQGGHLIPVAISMLLFGLGAGLPLMVLGYSSRSQFNRWRTRLMSTGQWGKKLLGGLLLLLGVSILTGLDKQLETQLIALTPDWLNTLTTRY